MTLNHQCPKCRKTFCSPSKLQRHFLIHTGLKPYSCVICLKDFRQKVHLKSHLTAKKCSLSAGTGRKKGKFVNSRKTTCLQPQSSLQLQPTSHHTPGNSSVELELQCKISVNDVQDRNKTEIKSEKQEQQHVTHKDQKPFQCIICSRSFQLEVNLIRHHEIHRNHNELGSSTSEQSNDVNMSDSETIQHLPEPRHADPIDLNIIVKPETWSGTRSDYNDSLSQDSVLITSAEQQREAYHASNEQQRMYSLNQCHACLKCFPSASKLQRHMMTHTGQRPFGCETCGKRFRQKTHLRVHCRTHLGSRYHKQRSLYINRPPSRIGGFNTRTAANVPEQEMLLHKNDFETHTGIDVVSAKHLNQSPSIITIQHNRESNNKLLPHISKKNEVVQKVSKVTVKRKQAATSMRLPGNVQHKCFQCLKCFPSASKLQRHELVHTGLRPFQCVLCGKAFRQASYLKTHERSHCERKQSRLVNLQGNSRKLKANRQQQPFPRVSVHIPQQNSSVNTDTTLSNSNDAEDNGVKVLLCTRSEISVTKVNSLFKTNSKKNSNVIGKKRKHNTSPKPSKLSRDLVTHSGLRPYKCTMCSKTFTQCRLLKVHEHRCRQGSHDIQGEIKNINHLQDKCIETLSDCTDLNVDATKEQPGSHASVGSFTDEDLSYWSEAINTEWLAVPDVGLQEEKKESEKRQRDHDDLATDQYSYSFPSQLTFEINKLVQNQNTAAPPLSHQHDGTSIRNVEVPCQPKGVMAISDSNKLRSDKLVSYVVENERQPDNYWCEPITVFECEKCSASFESNNNLKQHICSTNVQPKMTESAHKYRCDICFKHFVSPSKLKRHYLIHTGQRPFRCDICGKTFRQSSHVTTHRLTH
ncbi:zinc finger protein 271 [Etheostoma spectabile]|uniref:zinc finger protein 271 n=1 Tax=Etheostoma spectabile TaxID=54343 RepID=UPI0013AFE6BD|nr:zinc finger protein 271-like [Etheostoma spectabile]